MTACACFSFCSFLRLQGNHKNTQRSQIFSSKPCHALLIAYTGLKMVIRYPSSILVDYSIDLCFNPNCSLSFPTPTAFHGLVLTTWSYTFTTLKVQVFLWTHYQLIFGFSASCCCASITYIAHSRNNSRIAWGIPLTTNAWYHVSSPPPLLK
jgi:hypothetical protein